MRTFDKIANRRHEKNRIEKEVFKPSLEKVLNAINKIMGLKGHEVFKEGRASKSIFVCRSVIFHVCHHRYSMPYIYLADQFDLDPSSISNAVKKLENTDN